MSDMDPDGMDPEFEDEADLDSPENITQSARLREQEARQAGTSSSQEKEHPIRSRRVDDTDEGENEDEEEEDVEPRSMPRSASHTPNPRESERNRPSSDRRR